MGENHNSEREVLADLAQCDAAWLTQVLREAGALQDGVVAQVGCEASASTTAMVAHLSLEYSTDARGAPPGRLFLKLSDASRLSELPKDFRLGDGRFYQRVRGAPADLPVPVCYDAAVDEENVRFHVLLEDLSATHAPVAPAAVPDMAACRRQMECLADFHACWWASPELERFGGLPDADEASRYARSVVETLGGFLDALGDDMPAESRRAYELFARGLEPAYGEMFQPGHFTVINGDAHAFNILLPRDRTGPGRIVDWGFHHVSVGTQDVRHTLGLDWPAEARRCVERDAVGHYHRRLAERGVTNYTWDDCWNGYRVGVIDNLFMPMWQWTLNLPRKSWLGTINRALAAVDDLDCRELLP